MAKYVVVGVLGSVVARVNSIDETISTVRQQMNMSDKVETKLRRKLESVVAGQVHADYGGASCTVHVLDDEAE